MSFCTSTALLNSRFLTPRREEKVMIDKNEIDTVLDTLSRGPDVVVPLVREVPTDIIKRRPAPGKWSAHEHACHLPHVQPIMLERLEMLLNSPEPRIESYEPGRDDPNDALLRVDLDEAMQCFVDERASLVDRLRELTKDEWAVTAEHDEYSHYSVFIMFRHLAMHDLYHAYRIEELLLKKDWGT